MRDKRSKTGATVQNENDHSVEAESVVSTNLKESSSNEGNDDTVNKEQRETEQMPEDFTEVQGATVSEVALQIDNDQTVTCSQNEKKTDQTSAQNLNVRNLEGEESDSKTRVHAGSDENPESSCKNEVENVVETVNENVNTSSVVDLAEPKKVTVMPANEISNDGSEELMSSPLFDSDTASPFKTNQCEIDKDKSKGDQGNGAVLTSYDLVLPCVSSDTGESGVDVQEGSAHTLSKVQDPQFDLLSSFCDNLGKISIIVSIMRKKMTTCFFLSCHIISQSC